MQIPFGPWLGLAFIGAVVAAAAYDLAMIAGHALEPWFGWTLP